MPASQNRFTMVSPDGGSESTLDGGVAARLSVARPQTGMRAQNHETSAYSRCLFCRLEGRTKVGGFCRRKTARIKNADSRFARNYSGCREERTKSRRTVTFGP